MVWQAVAGLGSNIAGAFINSVSSSRAAKKAFGYNKQLLDIQQKWQERMSNTAHQREVDDLRKAGLNPILSATGGSGASFGSASAPGMSVEPGKVDSDLGISSALALRQQKNTNKLTESQTKLNDKTSDKLDSDTKVNSANAKKIGQDIQNSIDLTKAQVGELKERTENLKEERKYIKYNAESNRASANAQGVSASANVTSAGVAKSNYQLNKEIQDIQRDKEKRYKEWGKKHPHLRDIDETIQRYTSAFGFSAGAVKKLK